MAWDDDDEWPRPRRRTGNALPLVVAIVVTAALGLLIVGEPGSGSQSLVDRLARAAGSLSGGSPGLTYDDGMDGAEGSGGPGYSFARVQRDGVSPVTWRCDESIPIVVNPAGAPADYDELVGAAITRVNDASGFRFEVVGETSERNFLDRSQGPVLLGFADEGEVVELAGDVAGIGGSVYALPPGPGRVTAVGGVVALDTDVVNDDVPFEYAEAVLVHELVHVLGLGHTEAPGELMRATGSGQTELGPGDRAGLAHLREAACS
ncbi:MAG: matrixin family metalloprotease [Dermatophilaceae bacterium]